MFKGEINGSASSADMQDFYDEAIIRLRHQTGGKSPKLGDWKDLFVYYGFIPEHDLRDTGLYKLLRTYLRYVLDVLLRLRKSIAANFNFLFFTDFRFLEK